jgi:hypothetical protein
VISITPVAVLEGWWNKPSAPRQTGPHLRTARPHRLRPPAADLLLCRDCLVHLSFADIDKALRNIRRSSLAYLLTTTFPAESVNADIVTGDWRPLNLQAAPFNLPTPVELINEGCTEGDGAFADKSLGLWRIRDLPGQ